MCPVCDENIMQNHLNGICHCGLVGNTLAMNTENLGSNLSTGRYSVTSSYPSGRLKNLRGIEKWSCLSFCLLVRRMSVASELGLSLCS